ncbi:preprotein translocase subunit SecA [Patescibacteria group bacterium]|nr:preprotein translocase subunit SecA [Patescibacteria group bacterium]MBU1730569.1 preprotein translocase subunit SecA [Patescibacteria group bacterium]MBU1956220.1 preprotein translocase subunit SecA [Patescibacteria group bacterium]
MSFLSNIFSLNFRGDKSKQDTNPFQLIVGKINSLEEEISQLSDEQLNAKTAEFKERLSKGSILDDILPEAFAVTREASKRVLGQRHYDVQLMGGIALHNGDIAEMKTGEGKTLVATLPIYLNALEGKGAHVVTVNDYLSRRDVVWMGQIYALLGLTSAVINHEASYMYDAGHKTSDEERDAKGSFKIVYEFLRPCSRAQAYAADITYGTNVEFGFDYLRDNIAYDAKDIVQRDYHYVIIDEIDSILIDEARTPLIISAPAEDAENLYVTFSSLARMLKKETDYTVDEKLKAIQLTDEGIMKIEKALNIDNIYTEKGIKYVHHLETAVRAQALFDRDKQYVVKDDEIIIVDEFTGRLQPGRRWSEGLHQAIEAKEGVTIQRESRTFASITYQNYFRMYNKLSGMTGTAQTSSEEFYEVYGLNVINIPTHLPSARADKNDLIFQTEQGKFQAIARKVKEVHEKGQPVLIGTVSIEKNELLSAYLHKEGVPHEVLNAKNHENEGATIAQAGKKGNVTIATNMAGRGVDIMLGGSPKKEEKYKKVKELGGLFVLGTERHEARRIDDQLRGRSGRQGDLGETQFFVSLEDDLMRVFASDTIKKMMGRFGIPEDQAIEQRLITRSLEQAQTKIEGFHFDSRKQVLVYDDVMNKQRQYIYEKRRMVLIGEDTVVEKFIEELSAIDEKARNEIEQKRKELGEEFLSIMRRLILQTIDMLWMEHLEVMDYMRSSVNLRAYGQRDPLVEYKKEGLRLFNDLKNSINYNILERVPHIGFGGLSEDEKRAREAQKKAQIISGAISKTINTSAAGAGTTQQKIGRNEMVEITNGKETKSIKYKKAEPLLETREWKLVE